MSDAQNGQSAESAEQQKAQDARAAAKEREEQDIYNNFATPLVGTFLNLPREPALLKCPSCGLMDLSQVENDMKWWAMEINRLVGCLFVTFCCCFCCDYVIPCKQTDRNHYCKNCGCYFGRAMNYVAPIKTKTNKN